MCELLVMAVDKTHKDPDKDRWCWKRGDVVELREDNDGTWDWGGLGSLAPEKGGQFTIIKLPGVTLAQLRHEASKRVFASLDAGQLGLSGKEVGRRAVKLDLDALDAQTKEQIEKQGSIEATKEAVAYMVTAKPIAIEISEEAETVKK